MNTQNLCSRRSLSPRPHRSLALNSGLASFSIRRNPATRFNRSRKGTNCIRQPCKRRRNVIAAYNLAQRMASLPQTLYTSYSNLGRQEWIVSDAACKHLRQFTALDECRYDRIWSVVANQTSSFPRTGQISGYSSLSSAGPAGNRSTRSDGRSLRCRECEQSADGWDDPCKCSTA